VGDAAQQRGRLAQVTVGDPEAGQLDLGDRGAGGDHERAPALRVDRQGGGPPDAVGTGPVPVGRVLVPAPGPGQLDGPQPPPGVDHRQPHRPDPVDRVVQQDQPVAGPNG